LTEEQSAHLSAEKTQTIRHEIADVQVYLAGLADRVGISILEAVDEKMILYAQKYPGNKVHGSASEYSDY
jgi:dCTP diphosphatase